MKKKSIKRHVYTREFKAEIVALAEKREKSVAQIARDTGINETMLHRWIYKSKAARDTGLPAFPGHGNPQDEEHIRQQKADKAQQSTNEILKKAGIQLITKGSSEKKYRFMESNKNRYNIRDMSKILGISRSGYYAWYKKKVST